MIKVHCGVHEVTEEGAVQIARICKRFKVPLFLHLRSEYSLLDYFLSSADVPIVLGHSGSGVYKFDMSGLHRAVDRAERYDNLWLDTSGTTYPLAREAVEKIGSHRMIFGSDAPHEHPGVALSMIKHLGLTSEDFHKICHRNLEEILNIRL